MAQILKYLVKSDKTLVPQPGKMYRKVDSPATPPEKFELPVEGKLSQDNRWVIMANLIPWNEFEEEHAKNFAEDIGAPALPCKAGIGFINNQREIRNKRSGNSRTNKGIYLT